MCLCMKFDVPPCFSIPSGGGGGREHIRHPVCMWVGWEDDPGHHMVVHCYCVYSN